MRIFFGGRVRPLALLWLTLATASFAGPMQPVWFAEEFAHGLDGRWQQVKFAAPTDYKIVNDGTNFFLQAFASNSCSALMAKLNLKPPAHLFLRWRWKIDHTPTNASDHVLADYDHSARVLIAFDTLIGPPRSINYLWANQEKIGTTMSHPLMSRAQMLVLETGNARAGQWITEERDVTADWRRLFGSKAMSKIIGLGVLTDTDSTHTQATAGYAGIELYSQ
jgi:hypothetical protein